MEQIWYTYSFTGPKRGLGIRSASDGLKEGDTRTDDLLKYMGYRFPAGTHHIEPGIAPVSLSLTDTRKYGHILLRKVYIGLDTSKRSGAFSSRLVILNEQSPNFSFREAIDLWNASFWRDVQYETDERVLGRDVRIDLIPSGTSPFALFGYQQRPALILLLSRVLLAFLSHENRRRFYILAPSSVVTALIWGVAHALPCTLPWWRYITFNTYDDDVSKADEFIVGTYYPPDISSQSLPALCYADNNLALHIDPVSFEIRNAHLSEIVTPPLYTEFALDASNKLVNGESLASLVSKAERLRIATIPDYLDLYEKDVKGKLLTVPQILQAMKFKNIDEGQLGKSHNLSLFVQALMSNPQFLHEGARDALIAFRQRAESDAETAALFTAVKEKVYLCIAPAMQSQNGAILYQILESLVIMAPATKDKTLWQNVQRSLSSAIIPFVPVSTTPLFPWETRSLLLSQWHCMFDPSKDSTIDDWLKPAWVDLRSLLRLCYEFEKWYLPEEWYPVIFRFRLEIVDPIPPGAINEVSELVELYAESRLIPALQELIQGTKTSAHAAAFFVHQTVMNNMPRRLQLLDCILKIDSRGEAAQIINGATNPQQGVCLLQKNDHISFVETYLNNLLPLLSVEPIAELVLSYLTIYFDYHISEELVTRALLINNSILRIHNDLRGRPGIPYSSDINVLLAHNIVKVLSKIPQEWGNEVMYSYLQSLQQLAPAGFSAVGNEAWLEILTLEVNPGQSLLRSTRELLLLQWVRIENLIKINSITRWLDVSWREIQPLLSLTIPKNWQFMAIGTRILGDFDQKLTPLPLEAKEVIKQNAKEYFAPILENYIAKSPIRHTEAAVNFVIELLQQQFPQRLYLMLTILKADTGGHATKKLSEVDLQDDLFAFVESHLPNLLGNISTPYTAQFIYLCLSRYFEYLDPANLTDHKPARQLLVSLSEDKTLLNDDQSPLVENLKVYIRCWLEIKKVLESGKSSLSLRQIQAFNDALRGSILPEHTRRRLNDTLAQLVAAHDFENREYDLHVIVYLLGQVLIGSTYLLESLVIVAGDQFGASPSKFFPYIKLVLQFSLELPDEEKQAFLRHSLNHLLKGLENRDRQQFIEMQKMIGVLSEKEKEAWELYLKASRFAPSVKTHTWRIPWQYLLHFRYWRNRRALQRLRKAIEGRMAMEVFDAYKSELDKFLTDNELKKVKFALQFKEAWVTENNTQNDQILKAYYDIWNEFQGTLYFTSEEIVRIREIERLQKAPGYAE